MKTAQVSADISTNKKIRYTSNTCSSYTTDGWSDGFVAFETKNCFFLLNFELYKSFNRVTPNRFTIVVSVEWSGITRPVSNNRLENYQTREKSMDACLLRACTVYLLGPCFFIRTINRHLDPRYFHNFDNFYFTLRFHLSACIHATILIETKSEVLGAKSRKSNCRLVATES